MFSKKFTTALLRDAITAPAAMTGVTHASNVVRLYEPLKEVKVHQPHPHSYTVVKINPYTLEEEVILYPFLVVDEQPQSPSVCVEIK